MRTETVEEFLKRGCKVTKLEKELNTINGNRVTRVNGNITALPPRKL